MALLDHPLTFDEISKALPNVPASEREAYLLDCIRALDPTLCQDLGPLEGIVTGPALRMMWVVLWRTHKRNPQAIVSKREMAGLFQDYGGDGKSVDVYLCRIRKLLKSNDVPFELETVWGVGVRLRPVS